MPEPVQTHDSTRSISEFVVDIEGYEGPLDLLLEMARAQRVDLLKISVLELAEQYAEFIETADGLNIDLAADYLVMAAWLTLIKSRLLLPDDQAVELTGEELASRLEFRLRRLQAMRDCVRAIMDRKQLGSDFFARGKPEQVTVVRTEETRATVLDLMQAYARLRSRDEFRPFTMKSEPVLLVEKAMHYLLRYLGEVPEWSELSKFLPEEWTRDPSSVRSATASTFAAMLELVRNGEVEVRQVTPFRPISLRKRSSAQDA